MSGLVLLLLRLLLACALYAFLAFALWMIWKDLNSQGSTVNVSPLILTIEGDANNYRFTTPEIVIGRDPICDFQLDNKTISLQHTRLTFHHQQWWVEDLKSKNGTYINQVQVNESLVISSGDLLRCGEVRLAVSINH